MITRDSKGKFLKGMNLSTEEKEKISISMKGINKGKVFSQESRNKMSIAKKGKVSPNKGKHWKIKDTSKMHHSSWNKGKKGHVNAGFKKGHKTNLGKIRPNKRGENCHFWKGGISSLNDLIRKCSKMKQWRSDVFQRDNWTCQTCGNRSCAGKRMEVEAHHIKTFSKIMSENNIKTLEQAEQCAELWDLDNGVTLCTDCHKLTRESKK